MRTRLVASRLVLHHLIIKRNPPSRGLVIRFVRKEYTMRNSTAIAVSPLPTFNRQADSKKRPQSVSLPIGALCTWKEISEYCGRGIRTLQRWEQNFGFPIHRPDRRNKSAVIASRSEIDEWFRTRPLLPTKCGTVTLRESRAKGLTASAHQLHVEAERLLNSSAQMSEQLRKAISLANRKKSS
jgi:hypothetical protein